MNRLYVIADIHGRHDLLVNLITDLKKSGKIDLSVDKLVFTGDYIDRGPDSASVIAYLRDLQKDHPDNVICLSGNHEWMAIMYYARGKLREDSKLWMQNGGDVTIESYEYLGLNDMKHDDILWLSKLPLKHEEPGFFFSHAPAPRETYRSIMTKGLDFTPDELVWTYHPDEFGVARDHGNGIVGVCGHMHALKKGILAPRFYDHYIFADAGCGCSPKAPLVAIEVKTREVTYAWPPQVVK